MSDVITVQQDHVVLIQFHLSDETSGETLDQTNGVPMAYLHGHGNLVPGLEAALQGKTVGDTVDVVVDAADAYGERKEGVEANVHRREFPKGMKLVVGKQFRARASSGEMVNMWITDVRGARVSVTANHPLSGRRLHFNAEVTGIRKATEQELKQGSAHGVSGLRG